MFTVSFVTTSCRLFDIILNSFTFIVNSLGAYHDGQGNICSENDQYIMSGNSQKKTDQTKRNPWKFSPCSVEYFKDFTMVTL